MWMPFWVLTRTRSMALVPFGTWFHVEVTLPRSCTASWCRRRARGCGCGPTWLLTSLLNTTMLATPERSAFFWRPMRAGSWSEAIRGPGTTGLFMEPTATTTAWTLCTRCLWGVGRTWFVAWWWGPSPTWTCSPSCACCCACLCCPPTAPWTTLCLCCASLGPRETGRLSRLCSWWRWGCCRQRRCSL
uniref:Secreted protein n=1 Tax=Ixodes ricinus TaxID=34613 RepID=A0A147BS58_IXORI